jgi:hypothetical protein
MESSAQSFVDVVRLNRLLVDHYVWLIKLLTGKTSSLETAIKVFIASAMHLRLRMAYPPVRLGGDLTMRWLLMAHT